MERKWILRLPPKGKLLVYAQIVFVMAMLWLRDALGFPPAISYLTDVMLVCLLVIHMLRLRWCSQLAGMKMQNGLMILIGLCMLVGVVVNLVNPLLVLWGMRNNLRFFAFFYICIAALDCRDIDAILATMRKFFWANVILCSIQFFLQGLIGDRLGGFFGTISGSNGYMNILLCCVAANALAMFFQREQSIWKLLVYLCGGLYIAVLAELKVFYVELVIMLAVGFFAQKPSFKAIVAGVGGVIAVGILFFVLVWMGDQGILLYLDQESLIRYLFGNGYTGSGDLNRFTAISQIYTRFFEDDGVRALFGFGLGNCDNSQYAFLQSDFYKQYGKLHYLFFSHARIYLEQGAAGLVLIVAFFAALFHNCRKVKDRANNAMALTALIFVPIFFVSLIYNSAIQLEVSYLMAFMAAIPFVWVKNEKQQKRI